MTSWKLTAHGSKASIQDALLAHDEVWDFPADLVVSGREIDEAHPDDWVLDVWMEREPTSADKRAVKALFAGSPPKLRAERLPDTDWVTLSQQGVEPVRAGRFRVRTPDHAPCGDSIDFVVPASQAFGTGQHETTAGCLAMLDYMKRQGLAVRTHADIGTGTGLLSFAAIRLWPHARATASDIDPVCTQVVAENCARNNIVEGSKSGALTMMVAAGTDHPLLQARGPYDLVIANILAGPLIELAADFRAVVAPGGSLLLAGLLRAQERAVRSAYRRQGFRLARRLHKGDWAILWLRKGRIR